MTSEVNVSVHMYTKTPENGVGCPFCDKAKAWFEDRKIDYSYQELTTDERQALYANLKTVENPPPTNGTVPQIVLRDNDDGTLHYIGGYEHLIGSGIESLYFPNRTFMDRE